MNEIDNPTLRISGPVDLLAAIPHLLGFHPEESLVLIGMTHGALVVTARLDLTDADDGKLLADTIAAMMRGGSTTFVTAVFTQSDQEIAGSALPYATLADGLVRQVTSADAQLLDCLLVRDQLWWSYLCADPRCCPHEGRPMPDAPTPFQAAATVAGLTVAPSRDDLATRFEPAPDREALRAAVERAEAALTPVLVDGHLGLHGRVAVRGLLTAIHNADRGAHQPLSDTDAARAGAAMRRIAIRDTLWLAIDPDGGGDELWLDLARRLPSPYDAAPLFLYGWSAWRQGNGALAGMAAEHALASDASYSAAQLLLAALQHAVDPRTMPGLHLAEARGDDNPGAA